MDVANANEYAW